jgi:hypothetical protein
MVPAREGGVDLRRAAPWARATGPFAVQLPIAMGAFELLAAWVVVTSRGRRGTLPKDVTELGVRAGGGVLVGGAVIGVGLLMPDGSLPRKAAFAVGGVSGALGWLAVPVWFWRLGRALSSDAADEPRSVRASS